MENMARDTAKAHKKTGACPGEDCVREAKKRREEVNTGKEILNIQNGARHGLFSLTDFSQKKVIKLCLFCDFLYRVTVYNTKNLAAFNKNMIIISLWHKEITDFDQ
jgi:hypothetical protein